MNPLTVQENEALQELDTQTLTLPSGEVVEVTTSWHHWLAYEELQVFYDWSEVELLQLVSEERAAAGRDFSSCFEAVIAYAYAGCREELTELSDADTWLPLPPSGYRPRREETSEE